MVQFVECMILTFDSSSRASYDVLSENRGRENISMSQNRDDVIRRRLNKMTERAKQRRPYRHGELKEGENV